MPAGDPGGVNVTVPAPAGITLTLKEHGRGAAETGAARIEATESVSKISRVAIASCLEVCERNFRFRKGNRVNLLA